MFRFSLKYPVILVLLLSVSTSVLSQTTPAGNWSGVVRSQHHAVRVDLGLKSGTASLRLDQPYACRIEASFLDAEKDGDHYRFKLPSSSGGFCDRLGPGDLIVSASSAAKASISFKQAGTDWRGELVPRSSNP